jgi:DNA modification methylase
MKRADQAPPNPPSGGVLDQLLTDGVTWADSREWLPALPEESIDLFFTSPPYANMRAYSRIHPDEYVGWFVPFAQAMLTSVKPTGSLVLNIKDRVVNGERHPYVFELVLALRQLGWKWIETYIWAKPNAIPGRFGPRTKDAWEYVFWFAKGRPYFDLDAVRVPYRTPPEERARRALDPSPRRNTAAGHGRTRARTYELGGADPGNMIVAPLTYNQHYGVAHTAAMPEALAEFVIKAGSPPGGVVIDPFAGSGTTSLVARRLKRQAGGIEIHREHVEEAIERLRGADLPVQADRRTAQVSQVRRVVA